MDNTSLVILFVGVATTIIFVFLERTGMLKQRWALATIGILSVIFYGVALWLSIHNWFWVCTLEVVGISGVLYIVFKAYHPRIETTVRDTSYPISQDISFAEIVQKPEHDKLRTALISANASLQELLGIKTNTDISNYKSTARKLIDNIYDRLGSAVIELKRVRAIYPKCNLSIASLMTSLQTIQGFLNRRRWFNKTLGSSKSKIDENAHGIIEAINNILGNELVEKLQIEVKPKPERDMYFLEVTNLGNTDTFHAEIQIEARNDLMPSGLDRYIGCWESHNLYEIKIPRNFHGELKIAQLDWNSSPNLPYGIKRLLLYYYDTKNNRENWGFSTSYIVGSIAYNEKGEESIPPKPEFTLLVKISADSSGGQFSRTYKLCLDKLEELEA